MKKTVIAIFLAIITVVGAFTVSAGASSIEWEHTKATVGDFFVLTLSGKNVKGLESTDMVMEYDPEAIEFVTSVDLIKDIVMASGSPKKGKVTVSIAYPYNATGDVDMAAITFKALKQGKTTLKISISEWLGVALPNNLSYDITIGDAKGEAVQTTTEISATTTVGETLTTAPQAITEPKNDVTLEEITTATTELTTEKEVVSSLEETTTATTELTTEKEVVSSLEGATTEATTESEVDISLDDTTAETTEITTKQDIVSSEDATVTEITEAITEHESITRLEEIFSNVPQSEIVSSDEITTEMYVLGDINGDGEVTAVDARIALRLAIRLENAENYKNAAAADADRDGKITAVDARMILRAAVKLEKLK